VAWEVPELDFDDIFLRERGGERECVCEVVNNMGKLTILPP